MPPAHRNNDPRVCGAVTTVQNQSTTFCEGELWAVEGTFNSHGHGGLIPSFHGVQVEGKDVIVHTADHADPDDLCPPDPHCDPMTAGGSPKTFAYGG